MNSVPNTLKISAAIVAEEHKKYMEAKNEKHAAEERLVQEVIATVRDALPAICTKGFVQLPAGVVLSSSGVFYDSSLSGIVLSVGDVLDRFGPYELCMILQAGFQNQEGRRDNVTATIQRERRVLEGITLSLQIGNVK
jgi:hypothetical protein